MKIELPSQPVDGYEIRWYDVEGPSVRVVERRLVYHARKTWAEVYPDRASKDGHPFEDEWQLFEDGICERRLPGWGTPRSYPPLRGCDFMSREEALQRAREIVKDEIEFLERQIVEYRKRLTVGDLSL